MDEKPKKRKLTPKQEKFARNVASGMTQVEAYRDAYDTKTKNKNTQRVKALHEIRKDNVADMIADLKARAEKGVVWTREMAMTALLDTYKLAMAQNSAQGATGALKELNAMYGFNEAIKVNLGGQKDNPIIIAPDEANL